MKKITFATTNKDKFNRAQKNLVSRGIELIQEDMDMTELQLFDGVQITIDKASQAFSQLQRPVLVNDDSWDIPTLNGFPGAFMKQCNHYLKAKDWQKLMADQKDRRAFLISHFAYHDGNEIHTTTSKVEVYFLDKPQGAHSGAPHLETVARKGSNKSIAEQLSEGIHDEAGDPGFWDELASIIKK